MSKFLAFAEKIGTDAVKYEQEHGASPTIATVSPLDFHGFTKALNAKVSYVDNIEQCEVYTAAGKVTVMADPDAPQDSINLR